MLALLHQIPLPVQKEGKLIHAYTLLHRQNTAERECAPKEWWQSVEETLLKVTDSAERMWKRSYPAFIYVNTCSLLGTSYVILILECYIAICYPWIKMRRFLVVYKGTCLSNTSWMLLPTKLRGHMLWARQIFMDFSFPSRNLIAIQLWCWIP